MDDNFFPVKIWTNKDKNEDEESLSKKFWRHKNEGWGEYERQPVKKRWIIFICMTSHADFLMDFLRLLKNYVKINRVLGPSVVHLMYICTSVDKYDFSICFYNIQE